jgi:hypothetical protein
MNWNNLEKEKCPECEKKLLFRTKGSFVNMKSDKNKTRALEEDYYFCKCGKFKISLKKFIEIKTKLQKKTVNGIPKKDKHLFSSGLIKF